MFGKNKIMKMDHRDGDTLHVVHGSPFLTIQGEGPYVGWPAVFVRLHGCHLRCTFCDTDFDSPDDEMVATDSLITQCVADSNAIADLIVITGGEPMRQNIYPLCRELDFLGFRVQIETAGTFWIENIEKVAEIICSPKTPTIHPMIYSYATAFKYVISTRTYDPSLKTYIPFTGTQPGSRSALLAAPRHRSQVYLSPMDEGDERLNSENRYLVGRLAIEYGVRAGIQLHKFLGRD
jgi:7-carboxy-7-deazaguanine synthase